MSTTSAPARPTFTDDEGRVYHGDEAARRADVHFARSQAEHETALRSLSPAARRAYATYKRTGSLPAPPHRSLPASVGQGARARSAHGPAPSKRRGSRRGATRGSPSSSDDDPSESEPRRCGCGCGADLTGRRPQTRFATDACRKRAERADFAQTAEGEQTVRFLVENSRLWQELQAERLGVAA